MRAGAWEGRIPLHDGAEGHRPQRIGADGRAGVRFSVERDVVGVDARCPSYGNDRGGLTLSLYPWAGSVEASCARGALAARRFEDFPDNATLRLSFTPHPAGTYYAELSRGTETVGVWKSPRGVAGAESYVDGRPVAGAFEFAVTVPGLDVPFSGDWALYRLLSGPTCAPAETDGVSDAEGQLL